MKAVATPPRGSREKLQASSSMSSSTSSSSSSRRRRKSSSSSSYSSSNYTKCARRSQHAAASNDADATPSSIVDSMSLYHNPLLLIIVALMVALCPSPWVVSSSSSSSAAEIIATTTTTTTTSMASTIEQKKESAKTYTDTAAMTVTKTMGESVERSYQAEVGEQVKVVNESSQICTSSQNENSEKCISEEAYDEEGTKPEFATTDATAIVAATESDASTTENDPMASDGTVASTYTGDTTAATVFTCQDIDEGCNAWTKSGTSDEACILNSAYMTHHCPVSCNTCNIVNFGYRMITAKGLEGGLAIIPFCQDNDYDCKTYADNGECTKNPEYMNMVCEASCKKCAEESNEFGVGQRLDSDNKEDYQLVSDWLKNTVKYMHTIKQDARYANVIEDCLNLVPDCTFWAAKGECDKNPDYMNLHCAPACMICDVFF